MFSTIIYSNVFSAVMDVGLISLGFYESIGKIKIGPSNLLDL